jgi:hypothetical protein
MEKSYEAKDQDEINAELFGNDVRVDYDFESIDIKSNIKGLETEVKQ